MANIFHSLPPPKRYKLLHQEESFQNPSPQSTNNPLPAKKRIESHHYDHEHEHNPQPSHTTTYCLPAKKRIWALPPFSPFGFHEEEGCEYPKNVESPIGFQQEGEDPKVANEGKPIREGDPKKDLKEEAKEEEEDEDGIVCAVCKSTDGNEQDPIVFCDGCDLMVHTTCYGNPLLESIPEGDWFCFTCQRKRDRKKKQNQEKFKCCLCPVKGGAMKPTTDGKWAHILCALLVPEVFFQDPVGRDGVDVSKVPVRRWEGECYLCGSGCGCVIQCSEPKCGLEFHASCGLEKELCLEYREGKAGGVVVGFCEDHTKLWKKQQLTGKFKIVPREEVQDGKRKN